MYEVSVILPCLNEELGIGNCISKILEVFSNEEINGEIILVDNGCTDNTVRIAESFELSNLKIIHQEKRGYGNAYMKGFKHATGKAIIMGDSDDTYDFYDIPRFLEKLQDSDFVVGSRFAGKMADGAMPFSHKYIGNPLFVFLLNNLHGLSLTEPSTGFVAIKKEALDKLFLRCGGMEFASEILIKAKRKGLVISEIPIDYGVRKGKPKLRTVKDGFRHLNLIFREKLH